MNLRTVVLTAATTAVAVTLCISALAYAAALWVTNPDGWNEDRVAAFIGWIVGDGT